MKLIDSNIIIYSAKEEYAFLRKILQDEKVFISEITRLEVLGFHNIKSEQEIFFNSIFSLNTILPISTEIINEAINLRKRFNVSVADSIIAATARLRNFTLYTNNEDDFKNFADLKIFNPVKANRSKFNLQFYPD